ncbi:hypothetical protein E2C01_007084 [Portunus trituberculatus]|uniref:Uncharacterized protein n=1 Tax=Portunus trituberculatus TaxID=210409 RepID=A0A5B7CYH0_PORTR|nr:hypothetical protein [Portunus trituberculatus]
MPVKEPFLSFTPHALSGGRLNVSKNVDHEAFELQPHTSRRRRVWLHHRQMPVVLLHGHYHVTPLRKPVRRKHNSGRCNERSPLAAQKATRSGATPGRWYGSTTHPAALEQRRSVWP